MSAFAEHPIACFLCQRSGCQGQCNCPGLTYDKPCEGCKKTPLHLWTLDVCDIVKDMRERLSPGGREAQQARYALEARTRAGQADVEPAWAECAAPVERLGVPHASVAAARRPSDTKAFTETRHWLYDLRQKTPALLLSGITGAGKTVAAAWACMRWGQMRPWWRNQPSGAPNRSAVCWIYSSTVQGLTMLRPVDDALLAAALGCELLVLDELGLEKGAAGDLAFRTLLSRRLDSGLPLIITTNLAGEAFAGVVGANVVSRLKANAYAPKLGTESKRANNQPAQERRP